MVPLWNYKTMEGIVFIGNVFALNKLHGWCKLYRKGRNRTTTEIQEGERPMGVSQLALVFLIVQGNRGNVGFLDT